MLDFDKINLYRIYHSINNIKNINKVLISTQNI